MRIKDGERARSATYNASRPNHTAAGHRFDPCRAHHPVRCFGVLQRLWRKARYWRCFSSPLIRALPFEAEGHNQIHALQQQPYSITSSDPQITSGEEPIA
jgi:hypothetical protein